MPSCEHLAGLTPIEPDGMVCSECVARGDSWVHLRACLVCGRVGCCDSSRNRHARRHFHQTGHPVVRSIEPGERWAWCYVHESGVRALAGAGE